MEHLPPPQPAPSHIEPPPRIAFDLSHLWEVPTTVRYGTKEELESYINQGIFATSQERDKALIALNKAPSSEQGIPYFLELNENILTEMAAPPCAYERRGTLTFSYQKEGTMVGHTFTFVEGHYRLNGQPYTEKVALNYALLALRICNGIIEGSRLDKYATAFEQETNFTTIRPERTQMNMWIRDYGGYEKMADESFSIIKGPWKKHRKAQWGQRFHWLTNWFNSL